MKTWIDAIRLALVWLSLLPAQMLAPAGLVFPKVQADYTVTWRLRPPETSGINLYCRVGVLP